MRVLNPSNLTTEPRPGSKVDWSKPIIDFATAWPFDSGLIKLSDSAMHFDDYKKQWRNGPNWSLDSGHDSVLGHHISGDLFVTSLKGLKHLRDTR